MKAFSLPSQQVLAALLCCLNGEVGDVIGLSDRPFESANTCPAQQVRNIIPSVSDL